MLYILLLTIILSLGHTYIHTQSIEKALLNKSRNKSKRIVKVKPWRRMREEEVQLLLILNLGARWG
jgi:hypothetical protein